jgi:Domain of unknown function (DUF5004)
MKKIFSILAIAAAAGFAACKPDAIKDYEAASSAFKVSDLSGTWRMTAISQTDEDATRKGFPYKTVDLTNVVNASQIKFTINMNGGNPGTFAIDHGTGAKLFKSTSGNWLVDNASKPSQMWFANAGDTVKFIIQGYDNFLNNRMVLKRNRSLGGKTQVSYIYSFNKQ